MGSKLRDKNTKEIIWLDFTSIPLNPLRWDDWLNKLFNQMVYPNEDLEPAGIIDEVLFLPPWIKQEQYGRLLDALESWGYEIDPTDPQEDTLAVYTFSYDWRQDNRISAHKLDAAIESWRRKHPGAEVWVMGHSNGGIVARWFIEKEGGKDHVTKLFLFASPWDGAPKAMDVMFSGLRIFLRQRFNLLGALDISRKTRDLFRGFPSAYHLLPVENQFLRDVNNQTMDLFKDPTWLETAYQRELLKDGPLFSEQLGNTLSVDTYCFFGRKLPTTTDGTVYSGAGGKWEGIEWEAKESGDGTVPERSAVHPGAKEKYPFAVDHGNIYVDEAVLEFLQWLLIDQYTHPDVVARTTIKVGALNVTFESDSDLYDVDEDMEVWVTLQDIEKQKPISAEEIEVTVSWLDKLPGSEESNNEYMQTITLRPDEQIKGRYVGVLRSPNEEGYYRLTSIIDVMGEPEIVVREMIAVERTDLDLDSTTN